MTIFNSIKLSLNGLRANKKRSFLTMLGIVIGVGSVIVIMSVGAGAQSLILNEISAFGSNLFGVLPGAANDKGPPASVMGISVTTLKFKDVQALEKIPHVVAVTPYVRGVDTLHYQNQKSDVTFLGVGENFLSIEPGDLITGRFFSADEVKSTARVAVLGYKVNQDLFDDQPSIGQNIKIKKQNFKIIGVREQIGTIGFENKDTQIYVPVSTAQKILLGIKHISLIRGKVDDSQNVDFVIQQAKEILRKNHNINNPENDDFSVRSLNQAMDVVSSITDALKFFLAGIAAISLLVGGIGIMNIMLVNVTERTPEIGLRKAVGATYGQIMKQFLVESICLTLIGGAIGIFSGIVIAYLIAVGAKFAGFKWDFVVTASSILLGLSVSVIIGIIFGAYPARQAAKKEPVEALRAE